MPTLSVLDAAGATQTINTLPAVGRSAAAAALPTAWSTEDLAAITAMSGKFPAALGRLAVAASMSIGLSNEDKAVLDALSAKFPAALGRLAATASQSHALSNEDKAVLDAISAKLPAALGRLSAATSQSHALSTEDKAALDAMSAKFPATLGQLGRAASMSVGLSTEDAALLAVLGELSTSPATSGTGGTWSQSALLRGIYNLLASNVTSLPHFTLDATSDLSNGNVSRSGTGEIQMLAAGGAGVTHKIHRYAIIVPAAGTVEIRDGAVGASGAMRRKHVFTGKGGIDRIFDPRPYAKGTAATAMSFYWSGTGDANIDFDYASN